MRFLTEASGSLASFPCFPLNVGNKPRLSCPTMKALTPKHPSHSREESHLKLGLGQAQRANRPAHSQTWEQQSTRRGSNHGILKWFVIQLGLYCHNEVCIIRCNYMHVIRDILALEPNSGLMSLEKWRANCEKRERHLSLETDHFRSLCL